MRGQLALHGAGFGGLEVPAAGGKVDHGVEHNMAGAKAQQPTGFP